MKTLSTWPWIFTFAALLVGGGLTLHWFSQRKARNEAAAIGVMKLLTTAQSTFREGDLDGDGVIDYATSTQELVLAGLLTEAQLSAGDYRFAVCQGDPGEFLWMAVAIPSRLVQDGERCFATNQVGVIAVTPAPVALNSRCMIPVPPCAGGCPPEAAERRCLHVGIGR